ncbi:MAG: WD40/YVTN/BNR-like repeat-containing protein, partial [Nevskiales bacterium]
MLLLAALLGGGTVSVVTLAQEEVAPAEVTAPVAEATPATQNTSEASAVAPASEEAPAAEAPVAAAPAVSIKPRPSEIARLSSKSLLLGITQAGDKLITVGDRGNILLSSDGNNWTQAISPTNVTLTAVAFADASNGWAVGHDAVILHTTDSGKTWQLQNFQPELNKPLFGIFPIDAQNAYAVGAYGLFLATQDGGAHRTAVEAGPITADGLHLNAMIRLNNGDLFIAGEVGLIGVYGIDQKALAQAQAQAKARVRRPISAAGASGAVPAKPVAVEPVAPPTPRWQRLTLPYEGSLFGALPRGEKGAMVYGLRGNVYVTDDVYSNQWTKLDIGSVQSIFGGALLAEQGVALVGADGALMVVAPDGSVRGDLATKAGTDLASGTLSGVLPWNGGLLVVGDLGVNRVPI